MQNLVLSDSFMIEFGRDHLGITEFAPVTELRPSAYNQAARRTAAECQQDRILNSVVLHSCCTPHAGGLRFHCIEEGRHASLSLPKVKMLTLAICRNLVKTPFLFRRSYPVYLGKLLCLSA